MIFSKKKQNNYHFRLSKQLHESGLETAHLRGENLSEILRRHLEAYVASQPTKQPQSVASGNGNAKCYKIN